MNLNELYKTKGNGSNNSEARKDSLYTGGVTESEKDIIQQRIALQQEKFKQFEQREFLGKSGKIREVFDFLSDDEIKKALSENDNDEVI